MTRQGKTGSLWHSLLPLLLSITVSLSCSSDDSDTVPSVPEGKICVLFSTGGLGDGGYNDMLMRGLQQFREDNPDVWLQHISPDSAAEGVKLLNAWTEYHRGERLLCVLAGSEYEAIATSFYGLRGEDSTLTWRPDYLLFESDNPEDLPLSAFRMSLFGAAYLCGKSVAQMGLRHPLLLLAHPSDKPTQWAAEGFRQGYGEETQMQYLSETWEGFSMPEEAYRLMYDLTSMYDFIFGVAGASNQGIYRYLREYPINVWTIGRGWNQYYQSSQIIGNMVKRIDWVIEDYLSAWLKGEPLPDEELLGLESGYVQWQTAPSYAAELGNIVQDFGPEAALKEREYAATH